MADERSLADVQISSEEEEAIKNAPDLDTKARLAEEAGLPSETIFRVTRGAAGTRPQESQSRSQSPPKPRRRTSSAGSPPPSTARTC